MTLSYSHKYYFSILRKTRASNFKLLNHHDFIFVKLIIISFWLVPCFDHDECSFLKTNFASILFNSIRLQVSNDLFNPNNLNFLPTCSTWLKFSFLQSCSTWLKFSFLQTCLTRLKFSFLQTCSTWLKFSFLPTCSTWQNSVFYKLVQPN